MRVRVVLSCVVLGSVLAGGCGVLLDLSNLSDGKGSGGATSSTHASSSGTTTTTATSGSSSGSTSGSSSTGGSTSSTGSSSSSTSTTGSTSSSSSVTGATSSSSGSGSSSGSSGVWPLKPPVNIIAPTGAADGGALNFHIDATEVTTSRYAQFIKAFHLAIPLQRDVCYWNKAVEPNVAPANDAGITPSAECSTYDFAAEVIAHPDAPVRCVDWCDAAAYCTWSGGWMCHGNEGKPYAVEWQTACQSTAGNMYPYATAYQAHKCVDSPSAAPANAGATPGCIGGYPGLHDMSGNVGEWLDCGCEYDTPDATKNSAYVGGGSFLETGAALACPPTRTEGLVTFHADVGVRCCYN